MRIRVTAHRPIIASMRRTALTLVLLAASAYAQTAREERWNSYFVTAIRSKWAKEELSENRVLTVRGVEKCDCPAAARWLMLKVIPADDAADVVREAVRVLTKFKVPATIQEMATIWGKKYKKKIEAKTLTLEAFAKRKTDAADTVIKNFLSISK